MYQVFLPEFELRPLFLFISLSLSFNIQQPLAQKHNLTPTDGEHGQAQWMMRSWPTIINQLLSELIRFHVHIGCQVRNPLMVNVMNSKN